MYTGYTAPSHEGHEDLINLYGIQKHKDSPVQGVPGEDSPIADLDRDVPNHRFHTEAVRPVLLHHVVVIGRTVSCSWLSLFSCLVCVYIQPVLYVHSSASRFRDTSNLGVYRSGSVLGLADELEPSQVAPTSWIKHV